jgi:hypothetical protein
MPIELTLTTSWKGAEEGRRGSKRSFQSKETILGLGGSVLEDNGMPPCQNTHHSPKEEWDQANIVLARSLW